MKIRNLNVIRCAGIAKIVKVCSQYPIKVNNGKICYNKENVNSTRLSNKVMTRKMIRATKRER